MTHLSSSLTGRSRTELHLPGHPYHSLRCAATQSAQSGQWTQRDEASAVRTVATRVIRMRHKRDGVSSKWSTLDPHVALFTRQLRGPLSTGSTNYTSRCTCDSAGSAYTVHNDFHQGTSIYWDGLPTGVSGYLYISGNSWFFDRIAMPTLARVDPERAHSAAVYVASKGLAPRDLRKDPQILVK